MAKKGATAALQINATTNEEWANILERKGLVLVDIYTDWSGPCIGMVGILKRIKMEMGGDDLSYITARSDGISALARFRGRSEPVWMFIQDGRTVNILFGANSPELQNTLIKELKRVQAGQPAEFSLPVSEMSPGERARMRSIEEARAAREAASNAMKEAAMREKFEARMEHYLAALPGETCLILFPWVFKDEQGNKREKVASPPYTDLEATLQSHFSIEQEIWRELDEDTLTMLEKEAEHALTDETWHMLTDGSALCMRLKFSGWTSEETVEKILINLLFEEPVVAETPGQLVEGCYVQRNLPPVEDFEEESGSIASSSSGKFYLTTIWVPQNPRAKALVFPELFPKYIDSTYPFKAGEEEIPIAFFKYEIARRKELQEVIEAYKNDLLNFIIFEEDKLPEPKIKAFTINQYEDEVENKTSNEIMMCVVKKVNLKAFLSFVGVGPYYLSDEQDEAVKNTKLYFPRKSGTSQIFEQERIDKKEKDIGDEIGFEEKEDDDDDNDDEVVQEE